jgi:serine/threonine-protein kinase
MNPESPAPDDAAERRWQLLETYWEAQVRGGDQPTATWVAESADDTPDLRDDLDLLRKLDEARRLLDADAQVAGPSAPAPGAALPAGTRLGECVIEKLLDCGGMGEVYLARHEGLQCRVAVKVLPEPLADDPEARERFRQGVKAQAQIPAHRNIAVALHAGTHAGRPYLIMEYVPGQDLKGLVRAQGPLPVARACAVIRQAAEGLAHAHKHGIIHRDVKPSNLMLTPDGTVKVLDLGLGKLLGPAGAGGEATLTGAGVILGTPDYLAPEQAQSSSRADPRSDLYSLGATFYYLLGGKVLFGGRSTVAEKLAAHAGEAPQPVRELRPEVPPAVAAVVHKLLAKKPEDRYASADALLAALDAAGRPWLRRHRRALLACGAAVVLLAAACVGGYLAFGRGGDVEPRGAGAANPAAEQVPALTRLDLLVQRRGQKPVGYPLVSGGRDEPLDVLDPLRPKDLVRLEGRLAEPAPWYLVWIDTAGGVSVQGRSPGPQADIDVPSQNNTMLPLSADDPAGVHLLVLVAGPLPAGEERLTQQLAGLGPPPAVASSESWVRPLRAPGAPVVVGQVSPSVYLRDLRARLPAGLHVLYVYPLPAEK